MIRAASVRRAVRRTLAHASTVGLLVASAGCGDTDGSVDGSLLLRPNGDVVATGNTVVITDSVGGDVMAAGGSVEFDGVSEGSYVGAAADQRVRGRVAGSVRAVAGNVMLAAVVGRNVTAAGGNVEVGGATRIDRNAYLAGGRVSLAGTVAGDLYIGGREVVLDGSVGGDVRIEAERLTVGPNALIGGELRYRVADEDGAYMSDPAATIAGGARALTPRPEERSGVLVFVIRMLAFVLCGSVVVALFPGSTNRLVRVMEERPGAVVGLGLLWLVLVPVAAVVTAVTVVGLPLAGVAAVLYGVSIYLAPIVPGLWIGTEMLPGDRSGSRSARVVRFVAGGTVVAFAILLPWIGWVARLLATTVGLGAAALALSRASSERARTGAAA